MPDDSSATISIGGTLSTADAVADLSEAILGEAGPDYDRSFGDACDVDIALRNAAALKEPLKLFASQAGEGRFPHIEAACVNLGLSYRRANDGHYAYRPAHAPYRHGVTEAPVHASGGIDEGACITLNSLAAYLDSGDAPGLLAHLVDQRLLFSVPGPMVLEGEAAEPARDDLQVASRARQGHHFGAGA